MLGNAGKIKYGLARMSGSALYNRRRLREEKEQEEKAEEEEEEEEEKYTSPLASFDNSNCGNSH